MKIKGLLCCLLIIGAAHAQQNAATTWKHPEGKITSPGMLLADADGTPILLTEFDVNNGWHQVFQNGSRGIGNKSFTSTDVCAVGSFNNLPAGRQVQPFIITALSQQL